MQRLLWATWAGPYFLVWEMGADSCCKESARMLPLPRFFSGHTRLSNPTVHPLRLSKGHGTFGVWQLLSPQGSYKCLWAQFPHQMVSHIKGSTAHTFTPPVPP